MKYLYLILVIPILVSCNSDEIISEKEQIEFEKMARTYQTTYMEGSTNLEEILEGMDKNIQMWENGKIWRYDDMVKFGPHLPNKMVIETYNEQRLLEKNLGYDFVTVIFINGRGDTLRETTSRIWKKPKDKWKIVFMNNLISKAN